MNEQTLADFERSPESLEIVSAALHQLAGVASSGADVGFGSAAAAETDAASRTVSTLAGLAESSDHPAHWFVLSEALHRQGLLEEAETALRRAHGGAEPPGFFFELVKRFPPRWQERIRYYWLHRMYDLTGKDVLEVGGQLPADFVAGAGPASWTCVDPKIEAEVDEGAYRRISGDATDIAAPADSFDVIFSSSAFEHFADLPAALADMHRVLRSQGLLYADFGPIWSSADGHHVRGAAMKILREADLWPFPPWAHLLMNRPQMSEFLAQRLEPEPIKTVLHSIYGRPTLNRLFYEDYVHHFHATPLQVVRIDPKLSDPPDERTAAALRRRQPGRSNFHVKGFRVVLRKD